MSAPHRLGDLQLAILNILWESGEASAAEVHRLLEEERGLAPTTIATMLTKMESKGLVTHRSEGRRFIYRSAVSAGEVRKSMISALTARFFDGDPAALVSHLLSEYEIDPDELGRLQEQARRSDHDEEA
ncbi:MAG TPA: BlaI/MecI/CopY family transcriptional regulator [Thermoanaerobaculia bacterium]|nr:BlaI/MecI/CopY family transcriptional regulator [Thermoanaerobaculia bacterium]